MSWEDALLRAAKNPDVPASSTKFPSPGTTGDPAMDTDLDGLVADSAAARIVLPS